MSHDTKAALRALNASPDTLDALDEIYLMHCHEWIGCDDATDLDLDTLDNA